MLTRRGDGRLTDDDLKEVVPSMKPRKLIFQALQSLQEGGGGGGAGGSAAAAVAAVASVPPAVSVPRHATPDLGGLAQQVPAPVEPVAATGPPPGTPENFVALWTFLESIQLSQYYPALHKNSVDLNSLPLFDEADFADLGIPKGPTVMIRNATARLRGSAPVPAMPTSPGSPGNGAAGGGAGGGAGGAGGGGGDAGGGWGSSEPPI